MTQARFDASVVAMVATQIRRYRKEKDWSAQDLSDACTGLGYPIPRTVLANMESGRRSLVSVAEILVLAQALEVPPVCLIFPLESTAEVQILPGVQQSTLQSVAWFIGDRGDGPAPAPDSAEMMLAEYRSLWIATLSLQRMLPVVQDAHLQATIAPSPKQRERHQRTVDQYGGMVRRLARDLRESRDELRSHGRVLPALPDELRFVDEDDFEEEEDGA